MWGGGEGEGKWRGEGGREEGGGGGRGGEGRDDRPREVQRGIVQVCVDKVVLKEQAWVGLVG